VDSTVFSLRSKVTTLDQAIKNFGLYRFRELVLLSSARKILTEPELLYRSVFVATCAKKISERLKSSAKDASEIFITALLMDLGSLFFFQKDNLFYRHIFDEESRLVRLLKEKERYGIDSHSLTTKILSSCQLPLEIEKILEDHKPEIHYSRFQLANAILDLAYRLAFMYQCEESEIQDLLCIDHFEKFELYKCEIDKDFVHKIHLEVQEVTSL
jgi:HD-like signal output (HDOD) protein